MNFFEEIQADKMKLVDDLEGLFSASSLDSLTVLPDAIDLFLEDSLKRVVARHAQHIFGASHPPSEYSFKVAGATFHVSSAPDLASPKKLSLAILPHDLKLDANDRKLRELTCKLPGDGAYSTVTFQIPHVLATAKDDVLKTIAIEIFSVGYSWMTERIVLGIRTACNNMSQRLYEYLRIMVQNKELLEGFVFSAAAKDKDFVVLDDSAARSALRLAAIRSKQLNRSAAAMALQMMLEIVPLSDSAILEAVKYSRSIDIDLSQPKYYQQGNEGFSESLQAVWGTTVSCFPVMSSGDFFLVAFFMTEHKSELEPLLVSHQTRLQEIATSHRKEILLNLAIVDQAKHGSPDKAGFVAEFLGKFLGSFAKTMH